MSQRRPSAGASLAHTAPELRATERSGDALPDRTLEDGRTLASRATSAAVANLDSLGIDRFSLGELLGRGGMGEVRSATDSHIGREVAIKRLRLRGGARTDAAARFLREAQVQGRLDHPAIVPVYDIGLDDEGVPYFAMKRLTGVTLAAVLPAHDDRDPSNEGRFSRRVLLDRLVDVCQAIDFAHSRGVVHRDLKPANIMLGDYGESYVLDWGVAQVEDDEVPTIDDARVAMATTVADPGPTETGALLGTPGYMSPEQMRGEPVDARTDIYALGCILFEILTGRPALPGGPLGYRATLEASAHHPGERFPLADIAPELDAICARATEPSRAARYQTVRDLSQALEGYLAGDRDLSRRRELADGHAARAATAFAAGDDGGRVEALRQAARALALDPEHRDAQGLLARVLLETPREMPSEVEQAIAQGRDTASRVQLRAASRAYVGYLGILPPMLWLGVRVWWPIFAILGLIAGGAVVTFVASRRRVPLVPVYYTVLTIQGLLLAMLGMTTSPLVALPSLVVGSIAVFATHPSRFKPGWVLASHLLAFLVPFACEWFGVVPHTFWIEDATLVVKPWALDLAMGPLLVFLLSGIPLQLVVNLGLTLHLRADQQRGEERLHLQSWHLRQLLPAAEDRADRRDGESGAAATACRPR